MNETDLAYIAGIVDGEGYIIIHRYHSHRARKLRGFTIRVGVNNTNEWLIVYLQLNFGGTKYVTQHDPKWKPVWNWHIEANKAYEFLKLVLPYLHLKKPQAELAIEFQERKKAQPHYGQYCPKPDAEYALEEAQAILSHQLNAKGVRR